MKLYAFLKGLLSGLLKLIYNLRVSGQDNVPADGAYVVVCNHISLGDVIVLGVACKDRYTLWQKKSFSKFRFCQDL